MLPIDYDEIRKFYNLHIECWNNDLFSQMTTSFIDSYVNLFLRDFTESKLILNAGSGGKTYLTRAVQFHADIAEKTLQGCKNAYVCNIVDMPFDDGLFDCVVCVGTVINYCEIGKALAELARVSKTDAYLVLEYERSGSGFLDDGIRNIDSFMFEHEYFDIPHKNLLYSDSHMKKVLTENGYSILKSTLFNTTLPWLERYFSEKVAHKLVFLEPILRRIHFCATYSHNCILLCKKINNK